MASIDTLFDHYEGGRMTRRQLVQGLVAALTPAVGVVPALAAEPAGVGRMINHVQLTVASIDRSREFYGALLGATKQADFANNTVQTLALPGKGGWVSLRQGTERVGQMDHFAIGMDNFNGPKLGEAVRKTFPGVKVDASERSVFLTDPDGFKLQLISKEDAGG